MITCFSSSDVLCWNFLIHCHYWCYNEIAIWRGEKQDLKIDLSTDMSEAQHSQQGMDNTEKIIRKIRITGVYMACLHLRVIVSFSY